MNSNPEWIRRKGLERDLCETRKTLNEVLRENRELKKQIKELKNKQ